MPSLSVAVAGGRLVVAPVASELSLDALLACSLDGRLRRATYLGALPATALVRALARARALLA